MRNLEILHNSGFPHVKSQEMPKAMIERKADNIDDIDTYDMLTYDYMFMMMTIVIKMMTLTPILVAIHLSL